MRIITLKTLRNFWTKDPAAEQPFKSWHDEARKAEWKTPAEFKDQYLSASIFKKTGLSFLILRVIITD